MWDPPDCDFWFRFQIKQVWFSWATTSIAEAFSPSWLSSLPCSDALPNSSCLSPVFFVFTGAFPKHCKPMPASPFCIPKLWEVPQKRTRNSQLHWATAPAGNSGPILNFQLNSIGPAGILDGIRGRLRRGYGARMLRSISFRICSRDLQLSYSRPWLREEKWSKCPLMSSMILLATRKKLIDKSRWNFAQ